MTLRDSLRKIFNRAREQATDMAQVARIKLEVRDLEGRRDQLFKEIGRSIYSRQKEGRGYPEFERACDDVRSVETSIERKRAELRTVRDRPGAAGEDRAAESAKAATGA